MATIEGNGNLVRIHCPSFKALSLDIWNSSREHTDRVLAAFLDELRPHSLESFKMIDDSFRPDKGDSLEGSLSAAATRFLQALSHHGKSLIELKLDNLEIDTISQFSFLKGCTNLVSLSLGRAKRVEGNEMEEGSDAFLELVAWLKGRRTLQTLTFSEFPPAQALMTSVFLENSIQLTSLKNESHGFPDTEKLLPALANQTNLEILHLTGRLDNFEYEPRPTNSLVASLSKLINLTELRLGRFSEVFSDSHIVRLASSLPKLEVWSTYGEEISDAIWDAVGSLKSLRSLELTGQMIFTDDGVLEFIEKLGPGNRGLFMNVKSRRYKFSWTNQNLIHERITQKVGGGFHFSYSCIPNVFDL